jgi:ubiquinone biosynthesis protein Coq4
MRVEIQVLADNAVSKAILLEIAWDGQWTDDIFEMRRHLIVKPVSSMAD